MNFFISSFTILYFLWQYLFSLLSSRMSKLAPSILDKLRKRIWIVKEEIKIVKEEIHFQKSRYKSSKVWPLHYALSVNFGCVTLVALQVYMLWFFLNCFMVLFSSIIKDIYILFVENNSPPSTYICSVHIFYKNFNDRIPDSYYLQDVRHIFVCIYYNGQTDGRTDARAEEQTKIDFI